MPEVDDVYARIAILVQEIGQIQISNQFELAELDSQVHQLKAEAHAILEARLKLLEAACAEVQDLIDQHSDSLPWNGKTLIFPTGAITIRKSPASIEIDDPERVIIKRIRAHGWLKRMTRQPERELDKRAMAKLPDLVAQLRGVRVVHNVNLVITPELTKLDLKRQANALRRLVSKS